MQNVFSIFRQPGRRNIRSVPYSNNNFEWHEFDQDASPNYKLATYEIKENNDPPPEIKYNFITRTRRDFPCDDDNKDICKFLIDDQRVVNCNINRFR